MRRAFAVISITFLFVSACGSDDDTESAGTTTTTTTAAADGHDDGEDEDEGEARDPDAKFGEEVCAALLQALEGNTEGLDRYADDDVLTELASDPFHGKSDDLTITSDGETCTMGPFGDDEYVLTLMGDGHVGQRAVAIDLVTSFDSAGGVTVEDAIATYRAEGFDCGDDPGPENDEILEIDGGTVVAMHCDQFAYQGTYELHVFDGTAIQMLTVEQWYDGGLEEGATILGYPFVEDGLLSNIEKGRGIGDCGIYQQWYLDGGSLYLSAVYAQDCEDTDDPKGPEDWPQVYPSGD